ncbi:MAG: antibiotic biosynthesis monooxygenase family protein [Acidimicrobiales bacterium]
MQAVLIEVNVGDVEREAGLAVLRERLVPAISAMPGFVSGTWLTGGPNGRGLSLTVWETTEHAQTFAEQFGVGASPQVGAAVERCEIREVAATA